MKEIFIGRERELADLNTLYLQDKFQLFVLYGRRRVGKTTLLNAFCKGKDAIFYSAEQSNHKLNLEKFSQRVFEFYGETNLAPFTSWTNALTYIDERQKDKRIVLVIDEFPYLVRRDRGLLSEFQHLIDHRLRNGRMFIVLCGSYMGFMEKEVLGAKSPLFGRRTGQLHLKSFDYFTTAELLRDINPEQQLEFYGAFGGTPLYLQQINPQESFEVNIKRNFLKTSAYLYEEPLLLLRQEVQEPSVYSAIIEAVAGGHTKSNEIATKIGEEAAKCLKYIRTLCELGILYKESPFGDKESSRKTIYGISDFMFRFWYRYIFTNRTLLETGADEIVWEKRIEPDYNRYMGLVFEKVCKDYLRRKNAEGSLPFLFTDIGRWWGTDSASKTQVEIDIVASDGENDLVGECKWKKEKIDLNTFHSLEEKAAVWKPNSRNKYLMLFSKSGFTEAVMQEAEGNERLLLVDLPELMKR